MSPKRLQQSPKAKPRSSATRPASPSAGRLGSEQEDVQRALKAGAALRPGDVLAVQRAAGNRAAKNLIVQRVNSTGRGVIQRRTQFKQLLAIGENYEQERTVQRGNLRDVITGQANTIRVIFGVKNALAAMPNPGDLAMLNAIKAQLLPAAPNLHGRVAAMNRDDTLADVTRTYQTVFERATLQDMPIAADGTVDDAALNARLVQYDVPPTPAEALAGQPNPQERSRVTIAGATLRRHDGTPVDTTNSITHFSGKGTEIFVVSPSGELHMASHKVGKYHHTSLLAGGNVALGGEMVVHGGTIRSMTNKSGHYSPSPAHLRQFLHILQKKGVPLNFQIWGFGLHDQAANITAAQWLATLPEKETYEFESTAALYEAYYHDFGAAVTQHLMVTLGWKTNAAGTGMEQADGTALTNKQVRQALKAHFGAVRSKVKKKNAAEADVIQWA